MAAKRNTARATDPAAHHGAKLTVSGRGGGGAARPRPVDPRAGPPGHRQRLGGQPAAGVQRPEAVARHHRRELERPRSKARGRGLRLLPEELRRPSAENRVPPNRRGQERLRPISGPHGRTHQSGPRRLIAEGREFFFERNFVLQRTTQYHVGIVMVTAAVEGRSNRVLGRTIR